MIPTDIKEYDEEASCDIGLRIQNARIEKGLSGVDLAEYLGIKKNQMSRIENGRANCSLKQMYIIAQLLECSVDYLMFGKKDIQVKYTEEQIQAIKMMQKAFNMQLAI